MQTRRRTLAAASEANAAARNAVFATPDLLQIILAQLDIWEHAAAAAHSSWKQAWVATLPVRRGLRATQAASVQPAFTSIAVSPDDTMVCIHYELTNHVLFLDSEMRKDRILQVGNDMSIRSIAISSHSLWLAGFLEPRIPTVRRVRPSDGTLLAEIRDESRRGQLSDLVIGPDALFAIGYNHSDDYSNIPYDVVAFDPLTLETRFRISIETASLMSITVVNDSLYCSYDGLRGLSAFSAHTGEPQGVIQGSDWDSASIEKMCFDGDRLYLVESDTDDLPSDPNWSTGRRIFVLTPEGRTLQVYSQKSWLHGEVGSDGRISHKRRVDTITPWGKKLLVGVSHLKYFLLDQSYELHYNNWVDYSIQVLDGL